jgi:6-phosphogluconolactonase
MSEVEWWEFDSVAELAEQAAGDIGFVIESALEAHGGARLALPGDSIPEEIYKALLKQGIDWSKVTIIPTDDFVGSAGRFDFLQSRFGAKRATIVPMVEDGGAGDYREAGRLADERLQAIDWPLDMLCLGMGTDGSTAAILQGPDFDRAVAGPRGRRAVGLHPEPMPASAPSDRVTLTVDALSSARTVMVVIRGTERREALEQAIGEGPLSAKGIGRVLAALDTDVDIHWCPD